MHSSPISICVKNVHSKIDKYCQDVSKLCRNVAKLAKMANEFLANDGYLLTKIEIGELHKGVYCVDYCRRLNDFGMNLLKYYFGMLRQVAKVVGIFSRHAIQISRIYSGGAKVRKIIRRGTSSRPSSAR